MRAMLCHCRLHLRATDDEALLTLLREHVIRAHPAVSPTEEQLRGIVDACAYDVKYFVATQDEELVYDPYYRPFEVKS